MENSLAALEDKAERKLWTMCRERERLQRQADELRRSLALCERKRELAAILDTQVGGGPLCPRSLLPRCA
jgi:hypothetical protein